MGRISIDKSLIKDLTELLEENNLSEITIQQGRQSVKVARNITSGATIVSQPNGTQKNSKIEKEINLDQPGTVKSPMVGGAYLSAEPNSQPYVKVGQHVKAGDTLLLIEAMKTFNEIKAPRSGIIKKIVTLNSQPVEYGDTLIIFE